MLKFFSVIDGTNGDFSHRYSLTNQPHFTGHLLLLG